MWDGFLSLSIYSISLTYAAYVSVLRKIEENLTLIYKISKLQSSKGANFEYLETQLWSEKEDTQLCILVSYG